MWLFIYYNIIVSSQCLYVLMSDLINEGRIICRRWRIGLSMLTMWNSLSWATVMTMSSNTSETDSRTFQATRGLVAMRKTNIMKATVFIISFENIWCWLTALKCDCVEYLVYSLLSCFGWQWHLASLRPRQLVLLLLDPQLQMLNDYHQL